MHQILDTDPQHVNTLLTYSDLTLIGYFAPCSTQARSVFVNSTAPATFDFRTEVTFPPHHHFILAPPTLYSYAHPRIGPQGMTSISVLTGGNATVGQKSLCISQGRGLLEANPSPLPLTLTLSLTEAIEEYTAIHAGRMQPLPRWAYQGGAVLGLEGGTDFVNATLQKFYRAGTPLAGVWLQALEPHPDSRLLT